MAEILSVAGAESAREQKGEAPARGGTDRGGWCDERVVEAALAGARSGRIEPCEGARQDLLGSGDVRSEHGERVGRGDLVARAPAVVVRW